MSRHQIEARTQTTASPDAVYAILADGASWPSWTHIDAFELERTGDDEPEGLGAVRVFRVGRYTMRERIVELVPARRFSYALLSGLPLRDYRGDVDLEPAGSGTAIWWHSSFSTKITGTAWFFRRRLAGLLELFATGLADRAAREHAAGVLTQAELEHDIPSEVAHRGR